MGYQHKPAAESSQLFLQPFDCINVEMVGWLIENQHVGVGHECHGKRNSLFLPARQLGGGPIEEFTQAQSVEHGLASPSRPDSITDRSGRQFRDLVERGDGDTVSPTNHTAFRLASSGQHIQQCCLSGAVDADHTEPVSGGHGDRNVREQRTVGPHHRHV